MAAFTKTSDPTLHRMLVEVEEALAEEMPESMRYAYPTIGDLPLILDGVVFGEALSDEDVLALDQSVRNVRSFIKRTQEAANSPAIRGRRYTQLRDVKFYAEQATWLDADEREDYRKRVPAKEALVANVESFLRDLRDRDEVLLRIEAGLADRVKAIRLARDEAERAPIIAFVDEMRAGYLAGELGDSLGTIDPSADGGPFDIRHGGWEYVEVRGTGDDSRLRVTINLPSERWSTTSPASINWSALGSVEMDEARKYLAMMRLAALIAEVATNAGLVVGR